MTEQPAPLAAWQYVQWLFLATTFGLLSWFTFVPRRRPSPRRRAVTGTLPPGGRVTGQTPPTSAETSAEGLAEISTPRRPRTVAIADWSAARASIPDGHADLHLPDASYAELSAGAVVVDSTTCHHGHIDVDRAREAWEALVRVTGSEERALAVTTRVKEIRRRELAATRRLERAFGAQP